MSQSDNFKSGLDQSVNSKTYMAVEDLDVHGPDDEFIEAGRPATETRNSTPDPKGAYLRPFSVRDHNHNRNPNRLRKNEWITITSRITIRRVRRSSRQATRHLTPDPS